MEYIDVVRNLVGQITPVGDTTIDRQRKENLDECISLVNALINDLEFVAGAKYNYQASMREMGEMADVFLESLR